MKRSLATLALLLMLAAAGASASDDTHHSTTDSLQGTEEVHAQPADDGIQHHEMGDSAEVAKYEEELVHGEHVEALEEEGGNEVMEHLAHHLLDANSYDILGYSIALPVIKGNFSFLGERYAHGLQVTKHMIGLLVAGLLAIVLLIPGTAKTRRGEVPHGFGNFLELLVLFVRDDVVYPNMGKEHGRKWLPFFLTLFFLILFSNLLGMIPWGTTPTGNVNVTAGLAIATLLGVFFAGIKEHGFKYLGTFIPHGVPWYIVWLLFPIEVFGLLVKHFALTIRLFANMLAGHTVIGVFLALILTPFVAFASVPGAVAISMLELFVAFLQSYIFVMLGSLFVGTAIHPH